MADQEFLASFGVEIDESGLDRLQKALVQNRELAEELAAAFDSARDAIGGFFRQLSSSTLPTGELSPYQRLMELSGEGISFALDLDASGAEETLNAFLLQAQELSSASLLPLSADPSGLNQTAENALRRLRELFGSTLLPLLADASGVISAGQEALSSLQSLYSSARLSVTVQETRVSSGSASSGSSASSSSSSLSSRPSRLQAATGGRFSSPTKAEIAEDGDPEYVIPVKKESIAVPLLRQLFGELSDSARETLQAGLGEKEGPDALSGLQDLLASAPAAAAPVIQQTSNSSVQAPVSINVTAAGSDPEAVGKCVYDVAEQYLLRTLKGAL